VSPAPRSRCISTLSTQRLNLNPTERRTPTSRKPRLLWRSIEAQFALSPMTATIWRTAHANTEPDDCVKPLDRRSDFGSGCGVRQRRRGDHGWKSGSQHERGPGLPAGAKGFDALAASKTDLARHGVPQRPDPRTQPGPAALWEQRLRRYQNFEHLEPGLIAADEPTEPVLAGFRLPPLVSCGFELSFPAPITIFSGTWTVPDLSHTPTPGGFPNHLHTFFGPGFLDVHVEMTVDTAQNITALIRIHTGA